MVQETQRFGSKLRTLRQSRNMTMQELANALGYKAQGYVSELESNKKMPTLDVVIRVSRFFGVPTDQLILDELDVQVDTIE